MIEIFLGLSIAVNVFGIFYVRWLLSTLKNLGEQLEEISGDIVGYSEHVNSLHELEMFYGDQTLQSLMEHSRDLAARLSDVDFVLNNTEIEEEEIDATQDT